MSDREQIESLVLDEATLNLSSFEVITNETRYITDVSLVNLTFTDEYPLTLDSLLQIGTLDHVRVDRSLFRRYETELIVFAAADGNTVTIVPEPTLPWCLAMGVIALWRMNAKTRGANPRLYRTI